MCTSFRAVIARAPSETFAIPAATTRPGVLALTVLALAGGLAAQPAASTVPANRDAWRAQQRQQTLSTRPAPRPGAKPGGSVEFRTLDGTGNNKGRPAWGSAGSTYLREASGAAYGDGLNTPAGANRPSARAISNAVCDQGPAETEDERGLSTAVYEFGQFLDHDIGLAKAGFTEKFDIPVPAGDAWFDPAGTGAKVIWLDRSAFDPATGKATPRQQINTVSSFIDGSQIYGTDAARADWLRSKVGGRLKVRDTEFGPMLPLNDGTLSNDDPFRQPATSLVVAGDPRANEQPGLTTLHTIFVREHNGHADRLKALHPDWNDERLYQEARRIVIAELQRITVEEFVPAITGRRLPPYRGYQPGVNPGLSNVFATAAYRIGHSMVGPDIGVLDERFEEVASLPLAEIFFNPGAIAAAGGVTPIVRYFVSNIHQRVDTQLVGELRNFLFGAPGAGGFDLAALNIQRGRDHGLPDYNTVRKDFGLAKVKSFAEITRNAALAAKLQALFGTVNNVDAWVGMLAEDHLPGASVGATHAATLLDQFARLRDGDRFWYQNNQFGRDDLAAIERTGLSDILTRNSTAGRVQPNVFFAADLAAGRCLADVDGSGRVDRGDYDEFMLAYNAGSAAADLDGSGTVDADDLADFLREYFAGC